MASRQLHWELLEELKCPVCLMYMASPINMCENGHNVCSSCKERISQCPTCRGKFVNIRNVTLEKLAASAIYPCMNRETGCEETFTEDNRDNHLSECSFQSRDCPFKKISGVDCPWTGTLSDIPDHITREHDSETAEVPAHFRVDLLDFVERGRYRKFVICMGELFYLCWEKEGDILSFGVFHFGTKNETEDFKYGIKVGNSEYCVSVTRKCHSYFDGDLKKLHHRDCVTLYHNTLLYCLNAGGYLSCEIEIGREKLDWFVSDELREFLPVAFAIVSDIEIGRNMSDTPLPPMQSPPPPTLSTAPPTLSTAPPFNYRHAQRLRISSLVPPRQSPPPPTLSTEPLTPSTPPPFNYRGAQRLRISSLVRAPPSRSLTFNRNYADPENWDGSDNWDE